MDENTEVRKEFVLEVEKANKEIRRNFFTVRAAKTWNDLPENVKKQNNVNSFKNAYDKWKKKQKQQRDKQNNDSAAAERQKDDEN